jgi:DNA repair exonuclease SbcCD ATPase subunit
VAKPKKKKNKKKNAGAKSEANGDAVASNGTKEVLENDEDADDDVELDNPVAAEAAAVANKDEADTVEMIKSPATVNGVGKDTSERLDALAKERDALREEVSELRKSLEALKAKHEEEACGIREQLDETRSGKEEAESKYEDLRERVTTIRSTLGERLKEYSV